MNQVEATLAGRLLKVFVVLLLILGAYIYLNPVDKKPTLF